MDEHEGKKLETASVPPAPRPGKPAGPQSPEKNGLGPVSKKALELKTAIETLAPYPAND